MDVRIEATVAEAQAVMSEVSVKTVQKVELLGEIGVSQVASFSCPSIAGTSISAVSPDYTNFGGLAEAA